MSINHSCAPIFNQIKLWGPLMDSYWPTTPLMKFTGYNTPLLTLIHENWLNQNLPHIAFRFNFYLFYHLFIGSFWPLYRHFMLDWMVSDTTGREIVWWKAPNDGVNPAIAFTAQTKIPVAFNEKGKAYRHKPRF